MKNAVIAVLAFALFISSCQSQEKQMSEDRNSYRFNPRPLNDDWSKWLVGEWESSGESEAGSGGGMTSVELALNGQFLIMKGEGETGEMTPEHIKYIKETLHASDEEIERFRSSAFKELQIHTIDSKTGEVVGYLFDSLRCIAEGRGRREGNKEIMEWKWKCSGQESSSVRITEKVSNDKFIITEKYTLLDGNKMEDRGVMTRRKKTTCTQGESK